MSAPYREPGSTPPPVDPMDEFLSAARDLDRCADAVALARGPEKAAEERLFAAYANLPESVRERLTTHVLQEHYRRYPGSLR